MTVEAAVAGFNSLNLAWPQNADLISEGDDSIRTLKTIIRLTLPNVNAAMNASDAELNYSVGLTGLIQGQLNAKSPTNDPTFTGAVVLPANTQIGTVNNAEIAFLSGVTSAIQGQINGKAALASPAFTGVPTAPTAAPGTSTTQLATTAFAAALSMSAVLPGQAGNADRYIRTDGATATWQFPEVIVVDVPAAASTNAAVWRRYRLRNAAALQTVVLPETPADGSVIGVTVQSGRRDCTITRADLTAKIKGVVDDIKLDRGSGITRWLRYDSTSNDWSF